MKKAFYYILIIISGFINGLLGSGGGIIAVPLLQKAGIETKKAHASSIAIVLALSIVSTVFYAKNGYLDWKSCICIVPAGLVGTLLGTIFLKKISPLILKRIFGAILIISGVRMFFI